MWVWGYQNVYDEKTIIISFKDTIIITPYALPLGGRNSVKKSLFIHLISFGRPIY